MQCSVGKGGKWGFMGKVDMSCKVVRSEGTGLKRDCKLCGKIQGVTGGTDQTLGECSLGQTIPI